MQILWKERRSFVERAPRRETFFDWSRRQTRWHTSHHQEFGLWKGQQHLRRRGRLVWATLERCQWSCCCAAGGDDLACLQHNCDRRWAWVEAWGWLAVPQLESSGAQVGCAIVQCQREKESTILRRTRPAKCCFHRQSGSWSVLPAQKWLRARDLLPNLEQLDCRACLLPFLPFLLLHFLPRN